jgi:hypothetical protein
VIDEPLAPHWRFDLGHRKTFEFRSALGLSGEGPAPSSAVFAYGIVPGLARTLMHPEIATQRDDLRLARVETVFASELDMSGLLTCAIDVHAREEIAAVISCRDERGAGSIVTVHLSPDDHYEAPSPLAGATELERFHTDPARCVAFAAATWDLNPAYWDRELAELAGFGGTVAPPGLPFALALKALEAEAKGPSSSVDVHFDRAARPGDLLVLNTVPAGEETLFELSSEDGPVLHGRARFHRAATAL